MPFADLLARPRQGLASATESARRAYENLNERERKLVLALGAVLAVIVILLPLYVMNSSISSIEDDNRAISDVLREIDHSRPSILRHQAERRAVMRLYEHQAPALGSFLEKLAGDQGIAVREVSDQPQKDLGRYRRRHIRVTLPNVGLAAIIRMMAAIENSPYPVSIERIHIDHYRGGDQYTVQLGVVAYDLEEKGKPPAAPSPAAASPPAAPRPAALPPAASPPTASPPASGPTGAAEPPGASRPLLRRFRGGGRMGGLRRFRRGAPFAKKAATQ